MAKETRFKMSEERLAELKEELTYLQTVREKEVAEQIKEARSFGDLSENSEYDAAKAEQGKLYSRMAEIKNLIENAEIIQLADDTGTVALGNRVVVRDVELRSRDVFQLVGSQEADPASGKISDESPLGRALIGRKTGETVSVEAPAGTLKFKIMSIDK
ncbi:MAG: transcription elongation factor GreA [Oscillospiraceae bacterium]|jgi:transcription elongation factor GreA|nr:transcription elongation factor GreA [Oscillospiraceae bacterium]